MHWYILRWRVNVWRSPVTMFYPSFLPTPLVLSTSLLISVCSQP